MVIMFSARRERPEAVAKLKGIAAKMARKIETPPLDCLECVSLRSVLFLIEGCGGDYLHL